jgi:hypothetical protein
MLFLVIIEQIKYFVLKTRKLLKLFAPVTRADRIRLSSHDVVTPVMHGYICSSRGMYWKQVTKRLGEKSMSVRHKSHMDSTGTEPGPPR